MQEDSAQISPQVGTESQILWDRYGIQQKWLSQLIHADRMRMECGWNAERRYRAATTVLSMPNKNKEMRQWR